MRNVDFLFITAVLVIFLFSNLVLAQEKPEGAGCDYVAGFYGEDKWCDDEQSECKPEYFGVVSLKHCNECSTVHTNAEFVQWQQKYCAIFFLPVPAAAQQPQQQAPQTQPVAQQPQAAPSTPVATAEPNYPCKPPEYFYGSDGICDDTQDKCKPEHFKPQSYSKCQECSQAHTRTAFIQAQQTYCKTTPSATTTPTAAATGCPGVGFPLGTTATNKWGTSCTPNAAGSPPREQRIACGVTGSSSCSVAQCMEYSPGVFCWFNSGQCYSNQPSCAEVNPPISFTGTSITEVTALTVYSSTLSSATTVTGLSGVKVTSNVVALTYNGVNYYEFYILFNRAQGKTFLAYKDTTTGRLISPDPLRASITMTDICRQ